MTTEGYPVHWCNPWTWVGSDATCNTSTPSQVGQLPGTTLRIINRPHKLPQVSGMLHPRSYATWETSQEVTYHRIFPKHARLTVKFLKVGFLKGRYTFGSISSHFNHLKPYLGYYIWLLTNQNKIQTKVQEL